MPVEEFLDEFLPRTQSPIPDYPPDYFTKVPIDGTEEMMHDPFIDLIEDLIPDFKVVITDSNAESNSDPPWTEYTMYKASVNISDGNIQFDKAEMHIEFETDKSWEPFVDQPNSQSTDPHPFESKTKKGRRTRVQFTDYMAEVFSRQHRIFGFSLYICDDTARFLRWDRAGVIVSAQFNYHRDSKQLVEFFWRFSHLEDPQRGHDPNVRLADRAEITLAEENLSKWEPESKQPVVVFTVPGEDKTPREFIAWKSLAEPSSVTGRCTRAYPVYEKATNKCYFLKDVWRAHGLDQEADILRKLAEENVEHVPKFLCGGDINGETTVSDVYVFEEESLPTDKYCVAQWVVGDDWSKITRRIHHRFVVDFIGKPLSTLENSKQLMQVVSDAYTGCRQAYERCGYIHRDISGRNILIDENGRGVLNDWDLAKHKDELEQSQSHGRTVRH
ncbi:hypothetical protein C0992_001430 [Termitomyces sp. T32_za158]|nr:hypothetical protein C0992_001430 [Termitomyces sp. T32_za158]